MKKTQLVIAWLYVLIFTVVAPAFGDTHNGAEPYNYEHVSESHLEDLNCYILQHWLKSNSTGDLNEDGITNMTDYAILMHWWQIKKKVYENIVPLVNEIGVEQLFWWIDVARIKTSQDPRAPDKALELSLNIDNRWMYQNLPGHSNSKLTANVSIIDDPMGNSSYTYEWELILPSDVSTALAILEGGKLSNAFCTFAAASCNEPMSLSDSGQSLTVKITILGNDYGNSGTAEVDFGIAMLGDVNNDRTVNAIDRSIINIFWNAGSAEDFTLRDCDLNCNGVADAGDRAIANSIWQGLLCQNSVSQPCPFR